VTEAYEPLEVALRVFAVPRASTESGQAQKPSRRSRATPRRRQPERTLVIDTETTTDASQRFLFGVWRYYVDRPRSLPGAVCVQEGILYADDLPKRDPSGFETLQRYVKDHKADVFPGRSTTLKLLSRSEFVEQVLWRCAYKARATVVGFNLPFDLSRLAIDASAARSHGGHTTYVGGHSLRLFDVERYRPRIDVKAIDSKRTLMGFTTPHQEEPFRGHFLDLRTLCFALTNRGHSLESACGAFDVPYTKRAVTHGHITEDYVTYCREDVEATTKLHRATFECGGRRPGCHHEDCGGGKRPKSQQRIY